MSVASAKADIESSDAAVARPNVYVAVLLALSFSHLLNDTIQSLIPAVYPILKQSFALDFAKIGMITLTFQVAGALFQQRDRSLHGPPPAALLGGPWHDLHAGWRGQSRFRLELPRHPGLGRTGWDRLVDLSP